MGVFRLGAGAVKDFRSNGAGCAVSAIDNNFEPLRSRLGASEPLEIEQTQPRSPGREEMDAAEMLSAEWIPTKRKSQSRFPVQFRPPACNRYRQKP